MLQFGGNEPPPQAFTKSRYNTLTNEYCNAIKKRSNGEKAPSSEIEKPLHLKDIKVEQIHILK